MKRFILFAVVLIVLALAAAPQTHRAATKVLDPMQAGPFPVGVTTTVLVDHSRKDVATNEDRTLVTEIWYPATDESRNLPKNKFAGFHSGWNESAIRIFTEDGV